MPNVIENDSGYTLLNSLMHVVVNSVKLHSVQESTFFRYYYYCHGNDGTRFHMGIMK